MFFDIFNKNGSLLNRRYLHLDTESIARIEEIEFVILPRLDWSDRYVDIMQQSQNELGKNLIVAGVAKFITRKINFDENVEDMGFTDETNENATVQSTRQFHYILKDSPLSQENTLLSDHCRPFITIYDRITGESSCIKLINSRHRISCLKYGPYDNGHIIAGMTNGMVYVYDSTNLTKMY